MSNGINPNVSLVITPEAVLMAVNGLISIAFQLYNGVSQIVGESKIPTWLEIINENKLLQDKIDAEKGEA